MTKRLIEERAATSSGAFGLSAMQMRALVVCCRGNAIPRGLPSRPLTGSAAWHLVASESRPFCHTPKGILSLNRLFISGT